MKMSLKSRKIQDYVSGDLKSYDYKYTKDIS